MRRIILSSILTVLLTVMSGPPLRAQVDDAKSLPVNPAPVEPKSNPEAKPGTESNSTQSPSTPSNTTVGDSPAGKVTTPSGSPMADTAPAEEVVPPTLSEAQDLIKARFGRFENTMLDMAEFLRKTDPDRAAILTRAIGRSKEDGVEAQMKKLAEILKDEGQLGEAVDLQDEVVVDLEKLLELLLSDDREKELAKEKERLEQYIKDLNKLISGQKDVRAGTERGEPGNSLEARQQKLAEKTQELGDRIRKDDQNRALRPGEKKSQSDEPGDQSLPGSPESGDSSPDAGRPSDKQQPEEGEKKAGVENPEKKEPSVKMPPDGTDSQNSKPGDNQSGDKKNGQDAQGQSEAGKPQSEQPMSEQNPSEGKPNESSPSQGKSSKGEGQPSDQAPMPGENEENSKESSSTEAPKTQGRDELEQAKKAMERAIENLKKELKKKASGDQEEALRELQQAKEKLEEILRQLREEERLLRLAGLEARFQRMLAQQIAIYNDTVQINKVPAAERVSRHELKSQELAIQENELVLDATKALALLEEEGTGVAFPEAVEQMRYDMRSIAERLQRVDVGLLTQTMETDVIDGIKEMIEALQKEIEKEKEQQQQEQQQQQSQSSEQQEALLEQIAELKMLKSLQLRINTRTNKLAKLFTGEQALQPEVVKQLQELSLRQSRVQQAAYDLATGRNK